MIFLNMFPFTKMEISEKKWDRSSANYTSENWKRNNECLTILSFGRNCKNWDIFAEIISNDAVIVTLILLQALMFTKKKRIFYLIPLFKPAETWFLSWH